MKLRAMSLLDEDNIFDLDSDPEVMKYLTGGTPSTRTEVRETLKRIEQLFETHNGNFGVWAAIEKSTEKFMGWFHFRPCKKEPGNTKRIELGYRFKKIYWGKGFATEGSKAFISKGFKELGVEEVFAITMEKNMGSRKVMEKVGLTFVRDFVSPDFPNSKELDVEYSLHKKDWKG